MKNIYLFFVFIMLIGCSSNPLSRLKTTEIDCPKILFSNEDTLYFGSYTKPLNIENISYQAELNNGQFLKGCKIVDNLFSSYLSILFILSPLQEEQNQINLPYYVATIDSNKNLKDIQYYSFNAKFNKNSDTKKFEETEIVEKILLKISNWKDTKSIVLGFMLDEERKKILN